MTYRKKNRLLLIGAALMFLLTYMLSIRKTIDVYREAGMFEEQSVLAASAPAKAAELEKQMAGIELSLGTRPQDDTQEMLLGIVTGYCQSDNISLREFPRTAQHKEKDMIVETNVFTVEGSFSKLLHLVYLLEQKAKLGKVSSVKFFSKKDPKTKTTVLNATIYLQNIKKTGDEN